MKRKRLTHIYEGWYIRPTEDGKRWMVCPTELATSGAIVNTLEEAEQHIDETEILLES